ncbi:MAG: hypothetical protein WCP77_00635 [Roseococcus sp.]
MPVTPATQSVQELRQLIALLEQSGMADQRPEARALLERSRAVLRRHQRAPRKLAGKFGLLLVLVVDAALLAALPLVVVLHLEGGAGRPALALTAILPLWLLFRLRHHAHWLGEGVRWAAYHLAWLYDWFAEAFSMRAMDRLEARLAAREVMWGWRQHRRALPHRPSLEDVAIFLAKEYGSAAAFRRAVDAAQHQPEWALRGAARGNRFAARLAALRWSALIQVFGRLAEAGALWPDLPQAAPSAPSHPWQATETEGAPRGGSVPPGTEPPPPEDCDPRERAARQADLRDMIRRKRQDISTAFSWKLKTEAEIQHRDTYLAQTRAEIAALEQELAKLGQ